jgi:DNA-binding transcriptional ArsR family regulator
MDDAIERIFHALGDPTRRQIFEKISRAPISVSALAQPFEITLAAAVQHVQVLEASGLVRTEKVGRVRTCRVEPAGLNMIEKWVHDRRSSWERKLDRLGQFLEKDES